RLEWYRAWHRRARRRPSTRSKCCGRPETMQVEMDHVWRTYHVGDEEVVALRDATVKFEPGELVAVVGPSGSGKSTFLQLIGLMDSPSSGEVRFDGRGVGGLPDSARTRVRLESLGFIFQRLHLL